MSERPKLRKDVLQREVEDELWRYDPKNGETLLLNATAAVAVACDEGLGEAAIQAGLAGFGGSLLADRDNRRGGIVENAGIERSAAPAVDHDAGGQPHDRTVAFDHLDRLRQRNDGVTGVGGRRLRRDL